MQGPQTCIGCGKKPPETDSFTLISAKFGWRLTRSTATKGATLTEWRCPKCWREHKNGQMGTVSSEVEPVTPPAGRRGPPPR